MNEQQELPELPGNPNLPENGGHLEDPDPDLETYVIQFVMRQGGGTTFMRIWKVLSGENNCSMDKGLQKHCVVSLGDACIFSLIDQDLAQKRAYPNEPAKHTHKGEKFIQYLLGQVHKFLHKLDAVPDRPPRTFAVYLQWCPPLSGLEEWKLKAPDQFDRVRQAINASYFSDGVRFRLVQDVHPFAEGGVGQLNTSDDWGPTYDKFEQLVKNDFKLKVSEAAVVLLYDRRTTSGTIIKKLYVGLYRYFWVPSEYCNKPHKVLRLRVVDSRFPNNPAQILEAIKEGTNRSGNIRIYISNVHARQELFPESAEIREWGLEEHRPTDLQAKDEVCKWMSERVQYGVIMDAGSSGTRTYVYKWQRRFDSNFNPGLPREMEPVRVQDAKKQGGIAELWNGDLSGLEKRVERYLKGLIGSSEEALRKEGVKGINIRTEDQNPGGDHVDTVHVSRVPLYILATGGMRELKEKDGQGYIHLRSALANFINRSGFLEPTYDTISGEAEGIFAWIDANFSVGNVFTQPRSGNPTQPHGLIEMGGQTVQLAFTRLRTDDVPNPWQGYKGPLTYIELGSKLRYHVFAKSWGALGTMAMWREHEKRTLEREGSFEDPCVPKGGSYTVDFQRIAGKGNFLGAMREAFDMFDCRDTACRAGDLCLARLERGCLLNEIEGLKLDAKFEKVFIGVSSISHAMRNLGFGNYAPSPVHRFFELATKKYSKSFQQLESDRRGEVKEGYIKKAWKQRCDALEKLSRSREQQGVPGQRRNEIEALYREKENNGIPEDDLINEMIQQKEYLLREMFTAGLALTTMLLGMGIPMKPYATGCVQLAAVWFRVEEQCLEAGINPTESLRMRLKSAAPEAFPEHFGSGLAPNIACLDKILEAIFQWYFPGTDEKRTRGNQIIEELTDPGADLGLNAALVPKVLEGLNWLKDTVGDDRYEVPYYDADSNKVENIYRDLCFEFVSKCLDWGKPGGTIVKNGVKDPQGRAKDLSWTKGKMLLHSVGTTAKVQSFDGWSRAFPVEAGGGAEA